MPRTFGTIIATRSGTFRGRYKKNGRVYYTPTQERAAWVQADLKDVKRAIDAGTWQAPDTPILESRGVTLKEWAEEWLDGLDLSLQPNTVRSYTSHWKRHILPAFGDKHWADITSEELTRWVSTLDMSPRSRENVARSFSAGAARAVEAGIIDKPPVANLGKKHRQQRRLPTMTAEDLDTLISHARPEDRALIALMAWCQLRYEEVAALQRKHIRITGDTGTVRIEQAVKDNSGTIGVPKSDAGYREIAIPARALATIRHHMKTYVPPAPDALLYKRSDGRPISNKMANYRLKQAASAAKLPDISCHGLRHAGLTLYGQAGATVADLMRRAGHADAKTVMIYQHADAVRDRELTDRM